MFGWPLRIYSCLRQVSIRNTSRILSQILIRKFFAISNNNLIIQFIRTLLPNMSISIHPSKLPSKNIATLRGSPLRPLIQSNKQITLLLRAASLLDISAHILNHADLLILADKLPVVSPVNIADWATSLETRRCPWRVHGQLIYFIVWGHCWDFVVVFLLKIWFYVGYLRFVGLGVGLLESSGYLCFELGCLRRCSSWSWCSWLRRASLSRSACIVNRSLLCSCCARLCLAKNHLPIGLLELEYRCC